MIYALLILAGIAISAYLLHDAKPELFTPLKRAWLQSRIKGWQRDIEYIHGDRHNGILAEQEIKRQIAVARSKLLKL